MRNLTFAMALAIGGLTMSAQIPSPASIVKDLSAGEMKQVGKMNREQDDAKRPARIANHKSVAKMSVGEKPSYNEPLINETPEGEMKIYQKSGAYFSYNWLTGMSGGTLDGTVSRVVTSPDGTKMYIQSPVSFFFDCKENWIVGEIEGNEVTFTFPQLISYTRYEYSEDNVQEYYDYALKLEYKESEEGGWYYPTENQQMTFKILTDGSLEPTTSDLSMIGECVWFDDADSAVEGDGYWSWQGNGDIITCMTEVTEKVVDVPADVEFETWSLVSGLSTRDVQIGVKGDNLYYKGLFTYLPEESIVGTIKGDKVIFNGGQYLGVAWEYLSTAYFLTGYMEQIETEEGIYPVFTIEDDMTFNYDAEKKVLSCPEGTYLFSSVPNKVIYYYYIESPYICMPDPNIQVKSLLTPIITDFFDYEEYSGYEFYPEILFDFPAIDTYGQPLDKSKLYYQVILDGEPYEFYSDEYELPNGENMTTDIPFGYRANAFWTTSDIGHGVVLYSLGFETLGIRTLYKNEDTVVYSDIAEVEGYSNVRDVMTGKDIVAVNYYDLTGKKVIRPTKGIFILQTTYTDGSVKAQKVVRK